MKQWCVSIQFLQYGQSISRSSCCIRQTPEEPEQEQETRNDSSFSVKYSKDGRESSRRHSEEHWESSMSLSITGRVVPPLSLRRQTMKKNGVGVGGSTRREIRHQSHKTIPHPVPITPWNTEVCVCRELLKCVCVGEGGLLPILLGLCPPPSTLLSLPVFFALSLCCPSGNHVKTCMASAHSDISNNM